MRPDAESLAYQDMKGNWELIRDLMGETPAMQAAGRRWLPQWGRETDPQYKTRLASTTLFNGLQRTVNVLTGKVFSQDIVVNDDIDPMIAELLKNVDLAETTVGVFANEWFKDGLQTGISHCLIDSPAIYTGTVAEAKQAGVRPYWQHVPAESLIFWESGIIGGRYQLTKIRIKKDVVVKDGEWAQKKVTEIREFNLEMIDGKPVVSFLVYRQDKDEAWQVTGSGVTGMPLIPLVTFYARKTGYMTGKPPLMDLAWTNLTHWRSSSEQRHCLGIGRRPFPAFMGFSEEDMGSVDIGPHSGVRSDNPEASVSIVEASGTAISAGRQDLQDLKEEMAVLGLELLVRKPAAKTATESSNEQMETDSELGGIVQNMEESLNTAIKYSAMWVGQQSGGTITVNKDFGVEIASPAKLAALQAMRATSPPEISWSTYIVAMMNNGVLPEDLDLGKEKALIAEEEANLGGGEGF